MTQTDVAIIGAGPVGLFAVFQCGMLGLKTHVFDALDMVGGQCSALYPEKPIYDIPGYPKVMAADLIGALEAQARPFQPEWHLGRPVTHLQRLEDGRWHLKNSQGDEVTCGAVLIAAGVGAFGPHRPPLEGLESFEGQSVFYYVKERAFFQGKRVVIAGGGDSAVDWALSLSEVASHVSVVHRRSKFRAAPASEAQLQDYARQGRIQLVIPYQLKGLEGQDGQLERVIVEDLEGGTKALRADVLLPFFGLAMTLGPIAEWGLALERQQILVAPQHQTTSLPGIYAAGDICTYPGKLKLILCGFSEVAMAAHHIRSYLHPDRVWHFEYSTTQGVPA